MIKTSELNPTGELREWYWITFDHTMVRGKIYNSAVFDAGVLVTIMNIIKEVKYKDHIFVITQGGEYFRLEYVHRNMNGV